MKLTVTFSCIALLLFSCTKFGKNIFVSGRVINPVTNKGIPDIEVDLLKTSETFSLSSGFKSVKSVYTDENGRFEINHLGGTKSYTVAVRTPASFQQLGWATESGYNLQNLGVKIGKRINVDYHALPYGKLKTNIYNITCEGGSDSITIDFEYRIDKNAISFGTTIKTGCFNMEGTPTSEVPMGYYDIIWTVTKPSSGTNTFTGEVFVPGNDIGEFTINY